MPRFNRAYDGGIAADDDANAGLAAVAGDGDGSVNAPKNALTNAFVRILSGTSSRMAENVKRWSIKLYVQKERESATCPVRTRPERFHLVVLKLRLL